MKTNNNDLHSFIGVSRSLPITAYIKMVDIWMISTMMYPFSVVTLYSVLEGMKKDDLTRKDPTRVINLMLDYGLPVLVSVFILTFWVLGFINTMAPSDSTC